MIEEINFLPYSLPEIGEEEINEVNLCLRSGWLTSGPKVKQFEEDFACFLGGNVQSIAVNSATAGLHLALEALGIGPGDEVITTTHTFTATAEVICYLGAHPVFVDINAHTLCIDPDSLEKAITPKTRAIIPVHFGGRSAEMDAIIRLANKYRLKVIEDAAHAFPATYKRKLIGSLNTDATVFSFYANKTITTGEGGMIVTRNRALAEQARIMRLHGIDRDIFNRFNAKKPSWYYEVVAPGYKYNMTDIAAALGIVQLKKAFDLQKRRSNIAHYYNEALKGVDITFPPKALENDMHSHHLYVIQLPQNVNRNIFVEELFKKGIGCSIHYIPLHLHPFWKNTFNLSKKMFPISQHVYNFSVSLPIYPRMTIDDAERVVLTVKSIFATKNIYLNRKSCTI